MPIANAIRAIFLIMYWPSRVGINVPCHAISGKRKSGMMVVIMWGIRRAIARRSNRGMRNAIPISISYSPSPKMNCFAVTQGSVLVRRSSIRELAGLVSSIFKNPNQKKTIKRAIRAHGGNSCLSFSIRTLSNRISRSFMKVF